MVLDSIKGNDTLALSRRGQQMHHKADESCDSSKNSGIRRKANSSNVYNITPRPRWPSDSKRNCSRVRCLIPKLDFGARRHCSSHAEKL